MGIGQRRRLPPDRLDHTRMAVSEATDRRTSGRIQHTPSIQRRQPDALASGRYWRGAAQRAMDDPAAVQGVFSRFRVHDLASPDAVRSLRA